MLGLSLIVQIRELNLARTYDGGRVRLQIETLNPTESIDFGADLSEEACFWIRDWLHSRFTEKV